VLGGTALGWAARDVRLLQRFTLAGLVGFGVGGLLNLLLIWATDGDASAFPPIFEKDRIPSNPEVILVGALLYAVAFLVRGTIGGAVLGVALPHPRAVRALSALGALGFGVGGFVVSGALLLPQLRVEDPQLPLTWIGTCALWVGGSTAVGGALLGAGVGLLLRPRGGS
jgi:hypothetical protein